MAERIAQNISVYDGMAWKTMNGQKVYDGAAWKGFQGVYDGADWWKVSSSKIKYSLFPGGQSAGLRWSDPENLWMIENNGSSGGRCWKCTSDTFNLQTASVYLTGEEGEQYCEISPGSAIIFRVSTKSMFAPGYEQIGIFTLADIDNGTIVSCYNTNNKADLCVEYRVYANTGGQVYNVEERVLNITTLEHWYAIAMNANGDVLVYHYGYGSGGCMNADEFVSYIESNPGEGTTMVTAEEQVNANTHTQLFDVYFGMTYFNPNAFDLSQIEADIPHWFSIRQGGLEVYEAHFAMNLSL